MHDMRYQLASLGDVLMDAKFAMVISEALPPSYDTLNTLTMAMVTNASQITTNTLITQILREERQKENQYSMAALFVKNLGDLWQKLPILFPIQILIIIPIPIPN